MDTKMYLKKPTQSIHLIDTVIDGIYFEETGRKGEAEFIWCGIWSGGKLLWSR